MTVQKRLLISSTINIVFLSTIVGLVLLIFSDLNGGFSTIIDNTKISTNASDSANKIIISSNKLISIAKSKFDLSNRKIILSNQKITSAGNKIISADEKLKKIASIKDKVSKAIRKKGISNKILLDI